MCGWRKQGALARVDAKALVEQSAKIMQVAYGQNNGNAWLFYVFAVCGWLPTNYRRSKGTARANFCFLCTGNVPETPRHLLLLPRSQDRPCEIAIVS